MPEDIHRTHEFPQHLDDPTVLVTTRRPVLFQGNNTKETRGPVGLKIDLEAFSEGDFLRSFSDKNEAKFGVECGVRETSGKPYLFSKGSRNAYQEI